ncbi:MAG: hypothetical protein JWM11_6561 [Planctomycetaceae bacterium]|nr:hypothetical protein [Planctomycetaceae bacterium]
MCLAACLLAVAGASLYAYYIQTTADERWRCKLNLKQLAVALHSYHDQYGSFPPAYVSDANGKPMHSWRVLLLPFLEQKLLYDEYRFDEPWDSPHNSTLAGRVEHLFNCLNNRRWRNPKLTNYLAVVGPDTMWPADRATKRDDVTDDASQTVFVVEVESEIPWMEPRDLNASEFASAVNHQPGQRISGVHADGACIVMADGTVRFLSKKVPVGTIQALLTRNGGETIDEF